MWKTSVGWFRGIAFIEGISFLVLLFIAMPLKYFADMPAPVKFVGMAHGALFGLYMIALLVVWVTRRWSFLKGIVAFIAAFVPFATFVLEAKLRKEQ
ncbi:DUF3817 domain-containing protein [Paenibacillus sp. MBLB4367]|uniref:DUF3817 domain-containing protein n=1 Tax=Paenibacillus sp. MBLB4367 TaxID=3384767 RepID=UPI003907F2C8